MPATPSFLEWIAMKLPPWSPGVLLEAAFKKMDVKTSDAREAGPGASRALRVMEGKLLPKQKEIRVPDQDGKQTSVYRTRFKGVFKRAGSDRYLLTLASGQIVDRSRDEVETHILLESYLREQYADPTTRPKQVISLQALHHADCAPPPASTSTTNDATAGAATSPPASTAASPASQRAAPPAAPRSSSPVTPRTSSPATPPTSSPSTPCTSSPATPRTSSPATPRTSTPAATRTPSPASSRAPSRVGTPAAAAGGQRRPTTDVTPNGLRIDQINQPALDRTVIFRGSGAQGTSAAIHEQNVARIKTQLTQTHCRQSISGDRNRCWLRTSWLPLLTKLPPEALAQKAAGMLSEPPHASTRHMPAILTAIGRQFREGPTTFLSHRRLPGNDRRAVLDEPVELGGRLNALPGYSSDWGRPADESVEDYLKDMQMAIARAAAIAERADSIHEEIRNQLDADSTATSDLAILLHRAFGVPTLVIEERNATQASDGQAPGQYVKVRALMPEGAEHAESASVIRTWASVNDEAFPLDSVVLPQLLEKYRDHHIIWLRNGHFEAYVPHTDLPPAAPPSATSS